MELTEILSKILKFFGWISIILGVFFLLQSVFAQTISLWMGFSTAQRIFSGLIFLFLAQGLSKKERWAWYAGFVIFILSFLVVILEGFLINFSVEICFSAFIYIILFWLLIKGKQLFIEKPKEKISQWFHNPYFVVVVAGTLILYIIGGVLAYQYLWLPKEADNSQKPAVCSQEVKICPDGSAVVRTGPNCEFAECPAVKADETADWLTYTNNKYGFQIKYPPMLEFDNSEDGLRIAGALHGASIYDVSIYPNPQNLLSEDFFMSQMNNSRGPVGFNKNEIVSVGGMILGEQKIKAEKIIWDKNIITVLIPKGNFMIEIEGFPAFDDGHFLDTFNKILSSFEFIYGETADWKTYRNEEYGFEFKIPQLFINNGYQITNSESPGIFYFQTKPIAPYGIGQYNIDPDQYDTMFVIDVYTQEYCQESAGGKCATEEDCLWSGSDECCCIRTGKSTFSTYLAENNKYFAYYHTGPSSGDMWYAVGWDKDEVKMAVDQMLSTFKFVKTECAGEGDFKCTVMGCTFCCSGLVSRYVKNPTRTENDEVACVEEMTMIKCVRCGDGICGKGENWCICPEDCQKPDPQDLELAF